MQKSISTLAFLLLLLSCGGTAEDGDNKYAKGGNDEEALLEEMVASLYEGVSFLEGVYGTSTSEGFGIENLFDGKPETHWKTIQGAGPDEGIMLYFRKPTYLHELIIKVAEGEGLDKIKEITLYGDGKSFGDFDPKNPIKIGSKFTTVFLRIKEVEKLKTIKNESEGSIQEVVIFNPKLSVGVSELVFSGKEEEILKIQPPVSLEGKIVASSTLKPANSYKVSQLFDSRKELVWVEGAENNGEEETLTFTLKYEIEITALEIWNGYQRSSKHFDSNSKLKTFEFGVKGGKLETYELESKSGTQLVQLKSTLVGKEFVLKIKQAYAGSKYKDLAISEMRFYDGEIPMMISTKSNPDSKELLAKNKGKILGTILDKRFKSEVQEEFMVYQNSIILRSDFTFVIYQQEEDQEADAKIEKIADGGWEVVESKSNSAKIRIFGKLTNLSESYDFYKGKTDKEYIQIFQDFLQIRKGSIKGTKFFGEFKTALPDSAFVDLGMLDKSFILDMKYATDDNFIGETVYDCGRCLMRYEAASALLKAQAKFKEKGLRIKFYDCYRPLYIQKKMWAKYPNPSYVANPYKGIGSIHNRGGAVDMTVVDANGDELDMGTPFDFFGKKAHQDCTDLPKNVLENRKVLRNTMESVGFRRIRTEWWHYSFANKTKFTVANTPIKC
jgi:D-alanyl-D-alanine dipeptidase